MSGSAAMPVLLLTTMLFLELKVSAIWYLCRQTADLRPVKVSVIWYL